MKIPVLKKEDCTNTQFMKVLRISLLLVLSIAFSNLLTAQDSVYSWDEKLILDGSDFKKEINLEVGSNSNEITVSISGKVAEGNFKVKLVNPKGITVSHLNLNAGKNGIAKGRLTESVDASPGIWVLKMKNEDATGKMNIELKQN